MGAFTEFAILNIVDTRIILKVAQPVLNVRFYDFSDKQYVNDKEDVVQFTSTRKRATEYSMFPCNSDGTLLGKTHRWIVSDIDYI